MPTLKQYREQYITRYANYLAQEGKRLIDTAFSTANFNKNKTQNLHDSYGSCVFYAGKEVPNTRRYVGRKALVGKTSPSGDLIFGRAEIDDFFSNYKPTSKGFELVTAVAMFYGRYLEKGTGRIRRKYRVISGLNAPMEALANKMGGKIVKINM